jgi:hypothetical protein
MFAIGFLIGTGIARAQDAPVIETAADLPATQFELPALPSVLAMEGGAEFDALTKELDADVRAILDGYRLDDAATERSLRSMLRTVALLDGRWQEALDLTAEIRVLEDKPAARETAGLLSDTYARAALVAGTTEGAAFEAAFRNELTARVAALDYDLTQDYLQRVRSQFQLLTPAQLQGALKGQIDANAEAQGMRVTRDFVATIAGVRRTLAILPLRDVVADVIGARIDAETTEKADLWTPRLLSLEGRDDLTPVRVGVWDSGTDPAVFGERMWTNAAETLNGKDDDGNGFVDDVHGIAFGTDWTRSTGALRPMPDEDLAQIDDLLGYIKGALDLQAGVESEEAGAFRTKMTSLNADEVMPFQLQMGRLGMYLHGTATAHTSQRDNPATRLVYARFDDEIKAVPTPRDEAFAETFEAYVADVIAYYKTHGVKVVNMSWRLTLPQIEATLASVESDADRRRERATAVFERMNRALVKGFESAPEILFVAGAGNEDEDVEFVKSTPAGINLPNVVTVGAVDVALQPASFTSYGASIDLYANGFEVPSMTPGGRAINISGTSLAAPQVTNLAAKLWATAPDLTVDEVRALITETSTLEGERKLAVIHPQAAFSRLSTRAKK